jgi:aspartate aminotransferase
MTAFDATKLLSARTSAVEEAAIIRMAQKARDLKTKGHDVVSLTLGEPDFDTPAFIQAAATQAMAQGFTHYAPVQGVPELRAALSEKLARENGLHYSAEEIAISNGAKQAITNAVYALIDEGDEVILLSPFWVAYEGIVRMAGGVPVQLHAGADEGFKVPASRIAAAITPKTKLIMLNSPNNPTGAVFTKAELEAIAAVVAQHPRLMLLSDEIYEYILFEGEMTSFGSLPGMRERTITINGFSKAYAMTGWRLGYAAAPLPVAKAMAKVQSTFTAGANAFVQRAAIAALKEGQTDATAMRESYRKRRDLIIGALKAIPGVRIENPPGTFYAFPDVSAFLGKRAGNHTLGTVDELCDWLLDTHGLACVPGSAFGDPNCLRLSFASSQADIIKGTDRLARALIDLI